nr:hypothetical protein [Amycolatopsis sp. RTGN1]
MQQVTVAAPDPSLPSLASVRDGVTRARERARRRWGTTPEPGAEARYAQAVAGVPRNAIRELDDAVDLGHLSIRTATRCLRLAWTLADLDDWPHPSIAAIHYILAGRQRAHQLLRTPAPR